MSTSGTFDSNGLTIEQTNAKTKGNFNASGLTVIDNTSSVGEKLLLIASQIALQLSHLQTGEVSYTKKKNVRRGKFLGQAILKNYSTIKINNVSPLAQELIDKAKRD